MPSISHDGCTLHYDIAGAGEPILFIQGVGVHGGGWAPQTEVLSRTHQCISFDNRGMGRSQPRAGAITVDRMAADALAVLDAAAPGKQAHVVGHSLGGPIALYLAKLAPSRVKSLTLLCTFAGGHAAAPLTARMMWTGLRSRVGTRAMRRRGFLGMVLAPDATYDEPFIERLNGLFGHDIADQPPVAMAQLGALRKSDARPWLKSLASIPTMVIGGAHDPISPPTSGEALAASIPGATWELVNDASHGLPITHADLVNQRIKSHVTR